MNKFYLIGIGLSFCLCSCVTQGDENHGASVQESSSSAFSIPAPPEVPPSEEEVPPVEKQADAAADDANKLLSSNNFEDLVGFMESENRIEWQRPDDVVATLGDLSGKKVMDLGAGTGYFAFRLREAGADLIAAEVDDRFLVYLSDLRDSLGIDRSTFEVRKVFYDDPLLRRGEVDVFFTVDTYHHIRNRSRYLKKAHQGIVPGGEIVIVDFKNEDTPHGPPTKLRLSGDEIKAELEAAGFDSVFVDSEMLPEQNIVRGLRRK